MSTHAFSLKTRQSSRCMDGVVNGQVLRRGAGEGGVLSRSQLGPNFGVINCGFSFPTGLDKIEFLQSHEMKEIYQKAFYIIEQYFGSEEEDVRVAPIADGNEYLFQPEETPSTFLF